MSGARRLAVAASLCICAVFASHPSVAADDDGFDIVGLKLGMSPGDARAALVAHGVPAAAISETRQHYVYSDGLKHNHHTEDFLHSITGSIDEFVEGKRRSDTFSLYFAPPPEGGQLVLVRRSLGNEADPLTNAQFRAAVKDKYGPPAEEKYGDTRWLFGAGSLNCIPNGLPTGQNSILDMVFQMNGQQQYLLDRLRNLKATSVEDCANLLQYTVGPSADQPAVSVQAVLVDIQAWVKAELAASDWVAGLRQDAIRKRESGGTKPAL